MPDEIIPIPVDQDELAEIYQVHSQIGEVAEMSKRKKGNSLFAPSVARE